MRARRGSALIEVLIGLVVLATVGTALITLLGQTAHSVHQLHRREALYRDASAALARLVLLDRAELAARAGRAPLGSWQLRVQPLTAELFDVSVAESDTSAALLRTTLYRPQQDSGDANP